MARTMSSWTRYSPTVWMSASSWDSTHPQRRSSWPVAAGSNRPLSMSSRSGSTRSRQPGRCRSSTLIPRAILASNIEAHPLTGRLHDRVSSRGLLARGAKRLPPGSGQHGERLGVVGEAVHRRKVQAVPDRPGAGRLQPLGAAPDGPEEAVVAAEDVELRGDTAALARDVAQVGATAHLEPAEVDPLAPARLEQVKPDDTGGDPRRGHLARLVVGWGGGHRKPPGSQGGWPARRPRTGGVAGPDGVTACRPCRCRAWAAAWRAAGRRGRAGG